MIKIPFGKYKDFAACVTDQKRKGFSDERARKICASIHKKITGKWPTEMTNTEIINKMGKLARSFLNNGDRL